MFEITEIARVYLAAFFTLVAVFYTTKIIIKRRNRSDNVVFFGARFSKEWWHYMAFRFFRIAIWGVCVCRLFLPEIDNYLGVFTSLQQSLVISLGMSLLAFGFVGIISIHRQVGDEWRSGIDDKGPRALITHGVYQYTRNPIFIAVMIAQFGFFLAFPSLFTLICLVVGLITLYRQIIVEEKHLMAIFPSEYSIYRSRVRRWI